MSRSLGGRTVFDDMGPRRQEKSKKGQLDLFRD
jgi:hypothetical protein